MVAAAAAVAPSSLAAAAVVVASSLAVRAVLLVEASVVGTIFSSLQAACSRARVPLRSRRLQARTSIEPGTGTEIVVVAAAAAVAASSLAAAAVVVASKLVVGAVLLLVASIVDSIASSLQAACSRASVPSLNRGECREAIPQGQETLTLTVFGLVILMRKMLRGAQADAGDPHAGRRFQFRSPLNCCTRPRLAPAQETDRAAFRRWV